MHKVFVSKHHHLRHWHHIYKKRRYRALNINAKQMSYAQIVSLLGSIIAGVLLDANLVAFSALAGAFVILPGIFDLGGSLSASLSAKINHRISETEASRWRIFITSLGFTIVVAIFSGLIVSLVGASIAAIFFEANFWKLFILAEVAIVICCTIGFILIGWLTLVVRRLGMNPDDIVGPIESSLFDILAVITLGFLIGLLV